MLPSLLKLVPVLAACVCLSCAVLERVVSLPTASSRSEGPQTDTPPAPPPTSSELRQLERETIEAVNRVRAQHDAAALDERAVLTDVARAHSQDMARRGYFSHRSPEGDDVVDRVRARGISYRKLGENIQQNRGYEDPVRTAIDSWLHSSGHRQILLDPAFTETGVGAALDEQGHYIFTQIFLKPE